MGENAFFIVSFQNRYFPYAVQDWDNMNFQTGMFFSITSNYGIRDNQNLVFSYLYFQGVMVGIPIMRINNSK